jgi:hypothetical protein
MKTKPSRLFIALAWLALPALVQAQFNYVTNLADSGPGTLRSAITNAAGGAVITFDPSLSGATITLSNTLTINTNLTVDASALPGGIQINGNHAVQIFNVASNITVFLNSLTITNGYASENTIDPGDIYNVEGGGIYNEGTLTLIQCTVSGNTAYNENLYNAGYGGGIFNSGKLTLTNCTLSGNYAIGPFYGEEGGGGIYNVGLLTLNQCTLSGNYAVGEYGFNAEGGGIYNQGGTVTLNQCTLSGNFAVGYREYGAGGGIYNNNGTLTLANCTVSGNSALNSGGGISSGGATMAMTNTIVGGNAIGDGNGGYGPDIINSSTLTYGGSNLVQSVDNSGGTITGPAPLTNAPDLAPLGNYGGPTQTMPPLPRSPAIGAGSVAANTFSTDQRGYPRTQNGLIDIGAVELQSPAANPPVLGNLTLPAGGGNGLQFTFTNAPAADFTVLTATDVSLTLTNWTVLGEVQQVAPGQYQFTDPQAATNGVRFYRVRSP